MSIAEKSTSILKRDVFLYLTRIFTNIVIARQLGPESLGLFIILQMIPSYAEAFGRIKFDIAAVYYLGKNKYSINDVVLTLNILALLSSSLIIGIVLWQFESIYLFLFSKTEYNATVLTYFILLQVPLQFLLMNYSYLFIYKEDMATYNRVVIIQALVSSVLTVALLLLAEMGLLAVVGSMIVGTLSALIYGIISLGKIGPTNRMFNVELIRDLFTYGSKIYVAGLIGHLQAYIANLLIVIYVAPTQVAFFSLARNFSQMLDRVPVALNTVLFPRFAKTTDPNDAAILTAKAFRLTFIMMAIIGFVALLLIYPAVRIMYGSEFIPVILPFIIMIPGVIFAGATGPIMQYFMSIDRVDLGITLPLVPLILQILLAVLFVPEWGPAGAAFALSSALVFLSIISVFAFILLSKTANFNDLMLRKADVDYLARFAFSEAKRILNFISPGKA